MPVRLGTNPIAWSNDDDRTLGADITLATCLAEAAEAGFSGIELGHKFPRRAEDLRPLLEAHGLDLVSGWYSMHLLTRSVEDEWAAMNAHRELLSSLGCKVMIVCDTTGSVHGVPTAPVFKARPVMTVNDWTPWAQRLTALGDRLAETGMTLAYHHHMGTLIQTEGEIDRLMTLTGPSVGLLYDTGHLAFAGSPAPGAVAARHADRIVHVHAKDIRGDVVTRATQENWSFLQAVRAGAFTVPGDGAIDFSKALTSVPQDYDGWMVVEAEQDPAVANPLKYATLGHDHLRQTATALGFRITR